MQTHRTGLGFSMGLGPIELCLQLAVRDSMFQKDRELQGIPRVGNGGGDRAAQQEHNDTCMGPYLPAKSSLGTRQPSSPSSSSTGGEAPIAMSPVFRNPVSHVRTAWQEGSLHVALMVLPGLASHRPLSLSTQTDPELHDSQNLTRHTVTASPCTSSPTASGKFVYLLRSLHRHRAQEAPTE